MQECLEPGRRYGWAVGLVLEEGRLRWSEVAVFQVTAGANREPDRPLARREEALEAEWTTDPAAVLAYPHGAGANLERIIDEIFSLPACVPGSEIFADVPASSPFCPFIEQVYRDQIISSCAVSPLRYCPGKPVTREQLAVTIERALRGTDTFRPTGSGGDVANRPPAASAITPLDTTGNVGAFSSVTIGADGLGLISYWNASNGDLQVAHCSNVNCSSATITTLDTGGAVGRYNSVTIGADGLGLISYRDDTNFGLKVAHCSDVNCSSATITPLDTGGDVGLATSVTIGSDGLGLISYWDATNGALKVAHCSNTNCTSATITPLDAPGPQFDFDRYTSIAIGADGLGLISYFDDNNGDLKVAHCASVNCTSATLTSLDTVGEVGFYDSIQIGSDGLGLISYWDATNGGLKVAHCSNTSCTSATLTSVDAPGAGMDVGRYTSVTIGADGLGLISYRDDSNQDLKVAHCSDVQCTSATFTALDTAGDVGFRTSITIGADGLGLISYFLNTDFDLKVAHCSNVFCAPYFRRR